MARTVIRVGFALEMSPFWAWTCLMGVTAVVARGRTASFWTLDAEATVRALCGIHGRLLDIEVRRPLIYKAWYLPSPAECDGVLRTSGARCGLRQHRCRATVRAAHRSASATVRSAALTREDHRVAGSAGNAPLRCRWLEQRHDRPVVPAIQQLSSFPSDPWRGKT